MKYKYKVLKHYLIRFLEKTRENYTGEGGCDTCGHGAPEYYNSPQGQEELSWNNLEDQIDIMMKKLQKEDRK